ncbi:Ppx/GppA phosphatase, partial [mine drainage metagenome]
LARAPPARADAEGYAEEWESRLGRSAGSRRLEQARAKFSAERIHALRQALGPRGRLAVLVDIERFPSLEPLLGPTAPERSSAAGSVYRHGRLNGGRMPVLSGPTGRQRTNPSCTGAGNPMTARQVHFPEPIPRTGRGTARTELGVTPLAHGAEEIGVVDLGSNSARLAIYAAAPMGPPWIVYESKELPRLATGIDERGRLTRPAQRGALETLERFQKILDDRGVRRRAAVATGVVRQAVNKSSFLSQVRQRTTLPLRVISGEEEARYAYLGVRSSLTLGDDLVADLGGGTLQLLRIRSGNPVHVVSLPLGALRMHREFLPHDPPKRRELQALRDYVDATLEDGVGWADPLPSRLVGVGGTFRATGHLLQASRHYPLVRVHGLEVGRRFLLSETARLSELPSEERRNVPGLSADRSDIILAGLVVISRLLRRVTL